MVMMALDRQKADTGKPSVDTLVCYAREGRRTAVALSEELRRQGLTVELDITGGDIDSLKAYARSKGIGGILRVLDNGNIEVHNLETGEVSVKAIDDCLNE
jgi:ATP phosphoribosyltransferase regulatory subunit